MRVARASVDGRLVGNLVRCMTSLHEKVNPSTGCSSIRLTCKTFKARRISPRESLRSACRPSSVRLTLLRASASSIIYDEVDDALFCLDDKIETLLDFELGQGTESARKVSGIESTIDEIRT